MFEKFTKFFLDNEKITIVIIVVIALFGVGSYVMLPKQYNPSIVAPAFNIQIPVNGYSSNDSSQFVAKELENKIKELEGVDKIMSFASENFASTMVSFKVGMSQEKAKTILYDKIYGNYSDKPFGVKDVMIKSIDPEELPQLSLALTYKGNDLDSARSGIYLRNIGFQLKEEIKQVPGTTVIDIIGGYKNSISIKLDKQKIESYNLDIGKVVSDLQTNSIYKSFGKFQTSDTDSVLVLDSDLNDTHKLGSLVIAEVNLAKIYLKDISTISHGPINIDKFYSFSDKNTSRDAVLIGIAKQKGTNAVFVVDDILKKIENSKAILPKNVEMKIIQNEGETARKATSELLFHLFVSIFIVLVILIIFLGFKNALNAAFCIPMVLGMVFIFGIIFGLDINRITLFALILSLGILVDDSIVVVENNARHLAMMGRTGKTKHQAVLDSVQEVGLSIVMSTITRIMSFVAMFAVTGMMGDYMKPIPIFASIALLSSLFIAFSINPYLAAKFCKGNKCGSHEEHKESIILTKYAKLISIYIDDSLATMKSRFRLKILFWISFALIIFVPISIGIFKARMLPKADKNQVYLWIDAPRDYSSVKTKSIETKISSFILNKSKLLPKELDIAEEVTSAVGDRFLGDFANLFRGGSNRIMQNQISMRINLLSNEERDIKSEDYVIRLRPLIKNYIYKEFPDIKFRLLEDPPGPPTMATFHIKIKGQEDLSLDELIKFSDQIKNTVKSIETKEKLTDLSDTISSPYKKLDIVLNHDELTNHNITVEQVYNTLGAIYNNITVSYIHTKDRTLEPSEVIVGFDKKETSTKESLKNVYFTNQNGVKVRLDEIAIIQDSFMGSDLYTDNRATTINIYSEIGANSVVYPVLKLYDLFSTKEFEKSGYRKVASSPKLIEFVGIKTGKKYYVEWGGEWEITMDTFRDLGIAMIMSLLGIYFLIVAQFKSFRVGGIVMLTFLLSFFGIFPGFSVLYLLKGEYFTATAMIGAIALGGIVVGNAIILLDYIDQLVKAGKGLTYAVVEGSKKRFIPVMLTSIAAVFGSFIITSDPVWSGLAWSIIWGLSASAILTLFFIPILYFDYLIRFHKDETRDIQMKHVIDNSVELEALEPQKLQKNIRRTK